MLDNANTIVGDAANNTFFNDLNDAIDFDKLQTLIDRYSKPEVDDALGNVLGGSVADLIKGMINTSDLPEFVQDLANEAIDGAVAEEKSAASVEAEQDTQEAFQEIIDQIMEQMNEELNENLENAGGGSDVEGSGGENGKGGGNWLAVLARAMGEVAGKHLGNSVRLSEEIAANSGSGEGSAAQAEKMASLQAEMQAETQMFKMAQEALTTIVKSVGEALSSTARKQ